MGGKLCRFAVYTLMNINRILQQTISFKVIQWFDKIAKYWYDKTKKKKYHIVGIVERDRIDTPITHNMKSNFVGLV